jgi:hypothetical protein
MTSSKPAHNISKPGNVRVSFLFSLIMILLNGDHGKQNVALPPESVVKTP